MSFWSSIKSLGNLTFGSNKYVGENNWNESMGRFNDLKAVDIDGKELNFNVFDGKVLLITNVACKCGYTKGSYDMMQKLAIKYEDKGLRFLCFPCNQFMSQEPWTEKEIKEWVTGKWPKLNPILFSKIDVNGDNTHKTYKYLKDAFPGDINWNFATKFIVGKNGIPVQRFDKNQTWDDIEKCIKNELNKPYQSDKSDTKTQKNKDDEKTNDVDDADNDKQQENKENVDDDADKKEENDTDKNEQNKENVNNDKDDNVENEENKEDKDNDKDNNDDVVENEEDKEIKQKMDDIDKQLNDLKLKDEINPNDVKEIQESLKELQSNDDNIKNQINELQSQLNQYQSTINDKTGDNDENDNNENNDSNDQQ